MSKLAVRILYLPILCRTVQSWSLLSTRIIYILVHALRDYDGTKQRTSLESYVKDVTNPESVENHLAVAWRLPTTDPLEWPSSDAQKSMDSFRRDVFRLRQESVDAQHEPQESETALPAQGPVFEPLFIFIAHGLAAWWVKQALSHDTNKEVAKNVLGLIFLDVQPLQRAPDEATVDDYDHVIAEIRALSDKLRGSGKTPTKKSKIAPKLRQIDAGFESFKKRVQPLTEPPVEFLETLSVNIFSVSFLSSWMEPFPRNRSCTHQGVFAEDTVTKFQSHGAAA